MVSVFWLIVGRCCFRRW